MQSELFETVPYQESTRWLREVRGRRVETMPCSARLSDPDTSRTARTVDPKVAEAMVLRAFRYGDQLTDDEMVRRVTEAEGPQVNGPTLKTARSRLSKRGV